MFLEIKWKVKKTTYCLSWILLLKSPIRTLCSGHPGYVSSDPCKFNKQILSSSLKLHVFAMCSRCAAVTISAFPDAELFLVGIMERLQIPIDLPVAVCLDPRSCKDWNAVRIKTQFPPLTLTAKHFEAKILSRLYTKIRFHVFKIFPCLANYFQFHFCILQFKRNTKNKPHFFLSKVDPTDSSIAVNFPFNIAWTVYNTPIIKWYK
jgi:hypothetical protein